MKTPSYQLISVPSELFSCDEILPPIQRYITNGLHVVGRSLCAC